MQFTVLIEFLIPGVATIVLLLALFPAAPLPEIPFDLGDTVATLLLLVIAYPVGVIGNVPMFWFQKSWLQPKARLKILKRYRRELREFVPEDLKEESSEFGKRVESAFGRLHASVFARNIERLNTHSYFHQSLQRLARGMAVPFVLAIYWATKPIFCPTGSEVGSTCSNVGLAVVLMIFLGLSFWLLKYSVDRNEVVIANYYLQLKAENTQEEPDEKETS